MRNKQWSCGSGILGLALGLVLAGQASGQPGRRRYSPRADRLG